MFRDRNNYRIETPEDWWALLEAVWDDILLTTQQLGYDLNKPATDDLRCDGKMLDGKSFLQDLMEAKRHRDWERVHRYLESFWLAAPDSSYIHSLPSWHQLCDLCSEAAVAFEPDWCGKFPWSLAPGDKVRWNDPDDGKCSRHLTIETITFCGQGDGGDCMVKITGKDGSYLECFAKELS